MKKIEVQLKPKQKQHKHVRIPICHSHARKNERMIRNVNIFMYTIVTEATTYVTYGIECNGMDRDIKNWKWKRK